MDELIQNILKEKALTDSHDRYPVRFIFLPLSSDVENYVFDLNSNLKTNLVPLSSFFPQDRWATWETIYSKIESKIYQSDEDLIFLGLSEYLRFVNHSQLETIFMNLIGLENDNKSKKAKRRAYFVMHGFETLFSKYVQENHHRNIFYNPIIDGQSSCNRIQNITLIMSKKAQQKENVISTVTDYLDLSAKSNSYDFEKPIIVLSETMVSLSKKQNELSNDQLFNVLVLDDPLSLMKAKIIDLESESLVFKDKDLIDYISNKISISSPQKTYEEVVKDVLSLPDVSLLKLLQKFSVTHDSILVRIIKSFVEYKRKETGFAYINYLFENKDISSFGELVKQTYISLQDIAVQEAFYNQRIDLINLFPSIDKEIDAPNELISVININLSNYLKNHIPMFNADVSIEQAFYDDLKQSLNSDLLNSTLKSFKNDFLLNNITSVTSNEKRIVIMLLINGLLDSDDVEKIYPQLFGYMYYEPINYEKVEESISNYLKEYKQSKLQKKPTDYLRKYMENIIPSEFLKLYNDSKLTNVNNEYNADKIYVLDGVGAEYLGLISYIFEKKHKIVLTKCTYRKALLPTITEVNKQVIDKLNPAPTWKSSFDNEIIHGDFYKTDRNIEKALTLLEKIVDDILADSNGSSFLVIADHGSTVAHKIFNVSKKYQFDKSEHEGRCCDITGSVVEKAKDYLVYKDRNSKDWVLALTGTSLYNTPKHEAHGGATIEEAIVPYIFYEGTVKKPETTVTMIKDTVDGLNKTIVFTIDPKGTHTVLIKEQTGNDCTPEFSNDVYTATLSVGRAQLIKIYVDNKLIKEVKIKSSSGINNGGIF